MDAAFMSFQQRGWGIHVVSAKPQRAGTGGAEPSGWAQALRDAVRVRPSGHPADVALVAMGMLVAKDGNA